MHDATGFRLSADAIDTVALHARLDDPAAIPADWAGQPLSPAPGFTTQAGVFSAEAIDPGSAMLAAARYVCTSPPRKP